MPRLTEKEKDLILADYHTNKYSQRDLAKKHNVSLGTINKLTKDIEPQNEHLVNAQVTVLEGHSTLSNEQMNAVMNTANDEARRRNLVFGGMEKLAKLMNETVEKNKSEKVITEGVGKGYSKARVIETELQTSDHKNLADAYEKIGKSLGVIQSVPDVAIQNNQNTMPQINIKVENE